MRRFRLDYRDTGRVRAVRALSSLSFSLLEPGCSCFVCMRATDEERMAVYIEHQKPIGKRKTWGRRESAAAGWAGSSRFCADWLEPGWGAGIVHVIDDAGTMSP